MKSIDERIAELKESSECKTVSELDSEMAKCYQLILELRERVRIRESKQNSDESR